MEKRWTSVIDRPAVLEVEKTRAKLKIEDQIKYMRDVKGIKFTVVDETQAAEFLTTRNYYFKVKAFEKNYEICNSGENKGKYYDLEFAYLQELSKIDMYLREATLNLTLDIEHFLKVRLLRDISENDQEDGYQIVEKFMKWYPNVAGEIERKARDSYCEDLIEKYKNHFPVWAFVEVLSFGDLINFCDCYYSDYPTKDILTGSLRIVKFLRNACAHNNCLINNLGNNTSRTFKQNRAANSFVANISGISTKVRVKKMGNRSVHDFVVLLCCFNNIVTSQNVKKREFENLQKLFEGRFVKNREYFRNNALLCSNYDFVKKIIDKMVMMCI